MAKDVLDKEISVSVDLTPTGAKAKAKSRLVAAVDRMGGNLVELINTKIERKTSRERSLIEGEAALIDAATKYGVELMGRDPEFAQRALQHQFDQAFAKQSNKDGVLSHMLEDLRRAPIPSDSADHGPIQINEQVMDRLERYSEEASNEQLQEKWGRILATEIRSPGTVSLKTLRLVDELDGNVARIFEQYCVHRIAATIPKCLAGEIPFGHLSKLIGAGLLLDPGLAGHIQKFEEKESSNGVVQWLGVMGDFAIGIPVEAPVPSGHHSRPLQPIIRHKEEPAIPVYLLTEEGLAISAILPDNQAKAFDELVSMVKETMPDTSFSLAFLSKQSGNYEVRRIV